MAAQHIPSFVSLLQSNDDLLLAELVIPDLRPHVDLPQNCIKEDVVRLIRSRCYTLPHPSLLPRVNDPFNTLRLYREEEQIFQESEMHRASIQLCKRGKLNQAQQQDLRHWLDSCPLQDQERAKQ
ncbi:hypothetical protein P154DRAFT_540940 [Amniculicola lignicola CBS 123094]|uniref:Uncharacterized protein n=1 Tax=Amniculicola lignicola CBS 123094 TaxID=1392246 RepID=A0A6A5W0T2_9PLEO|nr:hypothetical protein P154DRAFT_540940 [Amniculicola lignicola CBS 123094]